MNQRLFAAVIAGVTLAPLTAHAQDAAADDVIVTGTTATATKTATPLVDIPQSVTLLDRRRLDDRASRTLNEALAYVAGVNTGSYGFDPRFEAFFIRGFQATYTGIFRDGLRQVSSPLGLWRNEPYGIERLAVVRGPASVLYGASGAAGAGRRHQQAPARRPLRRGAGLGRQLRPLSAQRRRFHAGRRRCRAARHRRGAR